MIYTCTLNPSLDYFVQVKDFKPGDLNRIASDKKMPGGKGINVSRVLKRLGVSTQALGFIGGFTGDFIRRELIGEGIHPDFIEVPGDTRINVKIKSANETEINGQSPLVNQNHLEELFLKLEQLTERDALVLSGSIPDSLPPTIYKDMIAGAAGSQAKVILDTSGQALVEAMEAKPFLIKPNHEELGQLFGVTITDVEEAAEYAKRLVSDGIQNVIVSMGGKGAVLAVGDNVFHAEVPKGTLKNSVGAGDSLVGGFLAEYSRGGNVQEAFRYGAAAGSATAFSVDLCTKEAVENLVGQVRVSHIK
ncbi:fructose-1-phosphate kinase [Scopulibacillus darangshiensis]|uniref:Tagatose-6-phosphate kinase n=1 Tax=Scopulibacillus darangshiensis TaxID=442528 RepID=A0A4R2NHQ5_9BACL|nr:1-phosphofructokinase [Scopulibacillus darangshiensis]TCP20860.1 fructose-1-phosphate kinase [Scopulibacillus darangshiensis]